MKFTISSFSQSRQFSGLSLFVSGRYGGRVEVLGLSSVRVLVRFASDVLNYVASAQL